MAPAFRGPLPVPALRRLPPLSGALPGSVMSLSGPLSSLSPAQRRGRPGGGGVRLRPFRRRSRAAGARAGRRRECYESRYRRRGRRPELGARRRRTAGFPERLGRRRSRGRGRRDAAAVAARSKRAGRGGRRLQGHGASYARGARAPALWSKAGVVAELRTRPAAATGRGR